jgi:hypothetical protein
MTPRTILLGLLCAIAMLVLYRCGSDPRRTRLPFGTTDLSTVQEPLSKLPPEERELVEHYVKRSNGDVLPAALGDPDNPLTARTFGEAIELERDWRKKMRVHEAEVAARLAQHDAKFAPLRALVSAEVESAEVLPRGEWLKRTYPGTEQPSDPSEVFAITVRVHNLSTQSVVGFRGSLDARDAREYLPMDLCWIDSGEERTIPPGEVLDIPCGTRRGGGVTEQERAFAAGAPGRFKIVWEPSYVKLADGSEYEVRH